MSRFGQKYTCSVPVLNGREHRAVGRYFAVGTDAIALFVRIEVREAMFGTSKALTFSLPPGARTRSAILEVVRSSGAEDLHRGLAISEIGKDQLSTNRLTVYFPAMVDESNRIEPHIPTNKAIYSISGMLRIAKTAD